VTDTPIKLTPDLHRKLVEFAASIGVGTPFGLIPLIRALEPVAAYADYLLDTDDEAQGENPATFQGFTESWIEGCCDESRDFVRDEACEALDALPDEHTPEFKALLDYARE
jgi:hypothetical protein